MHKYEGISKFSEIKIFKNPIYGEIYIGIFIEVIQFCRWKKNPNKCVQTSLNQASGKFFQREQTAIQSAVTGSS